MNAKEIRNIILALAPDDSCPEAIKYIEIKRGYIAHSRYHFVVV
jgi:hypothetical protein